MNCLSGSQILSSKASLLYLSSFASITAELEASEYTATAGGGAVEVTISGSKEITKIKLDPEVVDPDDIEMLEDLVMAAVNEAIRKMEEMSTQKMSKITGGLGGLF